MFATWQKLPSLPPVRPQSLEGKVEDSYADEAAVCTRSVHFLKATPRSDPKAGSGYSLRRGGTVGSGFRCVAARQPRIDAGHATDQIERRRGIIANPLRVGGVASVSKSIALQSAPYAAKAPWRALKSDSIHGGRHGRFGWHDEARDDLGPRCTRPFVMDRIRGHCE